MHSCGGAGSWCTWLALDTSQQPGFLCSSAPLEHPVHCLHTAGLQLLGPPGV